MPRIELVIRFGSSVSGRARPDSDVDLAVLGERELTLDDRTDLIERLARTHGIPEDRIDLVDLRTASPLLQHEVAEKGRLLEGTPERFLDFRISAWKVYQDTARLRRAREANLKKRFDVA
jgi:hypothetical protein